MRDDCRIIGHYLLEYVYGELDEALHRRVETHLQNCRRCSEDMIGYRQTLSLIDEATIEPPEELSENFSNLVLAILQRRAADRHRPVYRGLLAACFAGLLIGGSSLLASHDFRLPTSHQEAIEIPTHLAELGDPLVEEIAHRNLLFSARVKTSPKQQTL